MGLVIATILTEGLPPYPHVDHDPLHSTAYAEEYGEEPVRPKTSFPRHQTEQIRNVLTLSKHL